MTAIQIIFYVLSSIAIFSGLMVVSSSNPVRGALFLVLAFFAMGGVWLLLEAEFLALILVLVYVGAVMTLFLFVVMMLQVNISARGEGFVRYAPLVALVIIVMIAVTVMLIGPSHFGLQNSVSPLPKSADFSNIAELGSVLYTDYVYPFEIAAVLLLTAIVAAISLTHRKPMGRKTQNPTKQVAVRREDRVRLVNMPSEEKRL